MAILAKEEDIQNKPASTERMKESSQRSATKLMLLYLRVTSSSTRAIIKAKPGNIGPTQFATPSYVII